KEIHCFLKADGLNTLIRLQFGKARFFFVIHLPDLYHWAVAAHPGYYGFAAFGLCPQYPFSLSAFRGFQRSFYRIMKRGIKVAQHRVPFHLTRSDLIKLLFDASCKAIIHYCLEMLL